MLDPPVEIETIKALHAAFGDGVPLRIDPNCAWSVPTSVEVGRALQRELGRGGYLEDPCAGIDGMAAVRRRSSPRRGHAARQQRRGDVLRRSAGRGPPGRRADRAVRPALLGRRAADPASRAAVPDVRPRPVDALEQPSRRLADGDDARRGGRAAPDLRLRHALSLAARGRRGRGRRPHPVRRRLRRDPRPARASASSSITIAWRAAASATRAARTASATIKRRCASTSTRPGRASCRAGSGTRDPRCPP